eukprot:3396559-Pyramimonas_sp.AAC.1
MPWLRVAYRPQAIAAIWHKGVFPTPGAPSTMVPESGAEAWINGSSSSRMTGCRSYDVSGKKVFTSAEADALPMFTNAFSIWL